MKELITQLFKWEKPPRKGLLAFEWVVLGYMAVTLLMILFMYTKVHDPETMLWGRFRILAITLALWGVYRMVPCRLLLLIRVGVQLMLLSWWYPDTFELNRMLPNMDHVFAQLDQQIFGCQPALLFAQGWSHPVFSELMHLGYASYFFLIALVTVFYFLFRYQDFARASFVIVASFFAYYLIFIFLPVTGPQYYYLAIGLDQVAQGIFPQVGDYFATHQQPLPLPGYSDGLFYHMVENAHSVGERPTAAFPSSHVGITTILMLLAWQARSRTLLLTLLPFFLLMCLSTVYIQAHYVVDVFGGLVSAVLFYVMLNGIYTYIIKHSKTL